MPERDSFRPADVETITRIIETAIAESAARTLSTARFDELVAAGKEAAGDERDLLAELYEYRPSVE